METTFNRRLPPMKDEPPMEDNLMWKDDLKAYRMGLRSSKWEFREKQGGNLEYGSAQLSLFFFAF
jgi:hypothetical protein